MCPRSGVRLVRTPSSSLSLSLSPQFAIHLEPTKANGTKHVCPGALHALDADEVDTAIMWSVECGASNVDVKRLSRFPRPAAEAWPTPNIVATTVLFPAANTCTTCAKVFPFHRPDIGRRPYCGLVLLASYFLPPGAKSTIGPALSQ